MSMETKKDPVEVLRDRKSWHQTQTLEEFFHRTRLSMSLKQ